MSPYISLTRSYAVAESYALNGGTTFPTAANPAWVYEFEFNHGNGRPSYQILDPLVEIATSKSDPLISPSYHHNGSPSFLLGIVDPKRMARYAARPVPRPGGGSGSPSCEDELIAFVRILRDAEILCAGHIPTGCVVAKYPVSF
jgi:hypothetical protein